MLGASTSLLCNTCSSQRDLAQWKEFNSMVNIISTNLAWLIWIANIVLVIQAEHTRLVMQAEHTVLVMQPAHTVLDMQAVHTVLVMQADAPGS